MATAGPRDSDLDLTCPICYDTLTAPRCLPCQHTFCTECLGDLMERTGDLDHFLCPLCQAKVRVPEDGVTSFQINFYVSSFLAARARATPQCQACSKRQSINTSASSLSSASSTSSLPSSAVAECLECRTHLCRVCMEQHLQSAATARHTLSHLSCHQQGLQKTPDVSPSSSFDLSCDNHWGGPGEMTFFCRPCAALVCRPSCPHHQGPGHTVVQVSSEAHHGRAEIRYQLLSLNTLQGALADLEDNGKHRVMSLDESCRQVVSKMTTSKEQACGAITSRANKSAEKVNSLKSRIAKVVDLEIKNIQDKLAVISSLTTSAKDAVALSDAEFLRKKTKLVARIQSAMAKVPPSRGNINFSFKTSPDIDGLLRQERVAFGFMTLHYQSPVLRHKMELSSTKQERKLRKLLPRSDGTMLAAVGNCLVTIAADFTETKRLEFPAEIVDFLPTGDGFVFLVLPFPHSVKKLNIATDVAGDFVTPLNPPLAMAFTNKQELVFASNDGKELSLTFYSGHSTRLRRVTIPRPDFTPVSMAVTKRNYLVLCSSREILCLDTDYSDLATLNDLADLRPRCVTGLRGMGSGIGDVLVANFASGNVEVVELTSGTLTRKKELIQWKRGTSEEEMDFSKGMITNISCAVVDSGGRLWVGREDGKISVYDWLLRTS